MNDVNFVHVFFSTRASHGAAWRELTSISGLLAPKVFNPYLAAAPSGGGVALSFYGTDVSDANYALFFAGNAIGISDPVLGWTDPALPITPFFAISTGGRNTLGEYNGMAAFSGPGASATYMTSWTQQSTALSEIAVAPVVVSRL